MADLIGQRAAQPFSPERSGGFSIVQATFSASLLEVDGRGMEIPKFKDEIQARVQGDLLRLAGRFRHGLGWKEDRVKIVLKDVVHARVRGSQVELWLRNAPERPLQRIALELFTPESAGEFADWLPAAMPFPEPAAAKPAAAFAPSSVVSHAGLWVAILGFSLVMAMMLMVLVLRRV